LLLSNWNSNKNRHMIKNLPQLIWRFLVLVLLQVWIFNNIRFSGFLNPYIYVLFILLLPFETPGWFMLFLAFFTGLVIDMFSDTVGVHASAMVFMAALRPVVIQAISSREAYEANAKPTIAKMGFIWFVKYALILVFAHHLFLFTVEVFKFDSYHLVLLRSFLSTLFTAFFVVLSQYVIFRK
jgi:rod shape-determining protein MreD